MGSVTTRLRALDPRIADGSLAAAFMVAFGAEAVVFANGDGAALAAAAAGIAALGTLAVRRRHPIIPAISLSAAFTLVTAVASDLMTQVAVPFLAFMVALYSLGRYQRGVAVATAIVGGILAMTLLSGELERDEGGSGDADQLVWVFVLGGGPFLVGRAMRNRTRLQAELRTRTAQLERDRELRAAHAVEEERSRLATELQAVIANAVSAMVVQAETVPRAIEAGDSDGAARTFSAIESAGREALAETRRLLGILRRPDDEAARAPMPTLADAERLADRVRASGLEIDLTVAGEPVSLPPGPDLAAFRLLQEALESAASGGARSASVVVGYDAGELRLDVRDDRVAPGDRKSLIAMRERIGLYGGSLRTEEGANGFLLLARLPLNGGSA